MSLKLEVASLDDISEAQQALYTEKNGKYVLDVEGYEDYSSMKERVKEFRENNVKLLKQLEAQASHSTEEKAEMKRLRDLEKEYKDKQRIPISEMDNHVSARTKQLAEEYAAKEKVLTEKVNTYQTAFEKEKIGNVLRNAALRAGVLPEALDDVMHRGERVFRLEDGEVAAYNKDEPLYGKEGKPLQVDEWFDTLATTAKFMFAPNGGSDARGSNNTKGKFDPSKMSSIEKIEHGLRDLGHK